MEDLAQKNPIIFFDGVCGLCDRMVTFMFSRDEQHIFRYAAMQGKTAEKYLTDPDSHELKTIVLREKDGCLYKRSSAVIRCLQHLGGVWRLLALLLSAVPRPLRDFAYNLVAKHRYSLFGRSEICRLPLPKERIYFLG